MNDTRRDSAWLGSDYFENRRNFPFDELLRYAGQYVAFSWDGASIVAADPDDEELYRKLVASGIDPTRVVIDYVDPGDAAQLS